MNMAASYNQDQEFEYQANSERRESTSREKPTRSNRRFSYSRSSRPSVSHNGMHRRRNKRFSW